MTEEAFPASLQLDLFSWDRVKVAEGFRALDGLDFGKATAIFDSVLKNWEGHPDALSGLRVAAFAEALFKDIDGLPPETVIERLWREIEAFPFGPSFQLLRRRLVERIILLAGEDSRFFIPPDLCLGRLWFGIGEYRKAVEALEALLTDGPFAAGLLVCLGNSWARQGLMPEARAEYAKALLAAPHDVRREAMEDPELVEAIIDEDNYSAAICGWMRGVLPLLDIELQGAKDDKHAWTLEVYKTVRNAEAARIRKEHDKMVAQRRRLKDLAPAVFVEYMARF